MDEAIEKTIIDWYSNGCTLNTLIRYLNSVSIFGEVDKNKAIEIINNVINSYNEKIENELKETEKKNLENPIEREVTEEKKEDASFEKTCIVCNRTFYTIEEDVICCSYVCNKKYKKYKHELKLKTVKNKEPCVRTCPFCGNEFSTNMSDKIYCSSRCKSRMQYKINRDAEPKRTYVHINRKDADEIYKESFETPLIGEDSLFCDTKFLEQLFGKKIKKTDECK